MSMDYVRKTYGVPVGRWVLVRPLSGHYAGNELIVTSCSHLVHARHPFEPTVLRFHPHDIEYRVDGEWLRFDASPDAKGHFFDAHIDPHDAAK